MTTENERAMTKSSQETPGHDFAAVVQEAQSKARTLKTIVEQCGLARRIGDSEHLEVEAWQTIARGYDYTPKVDWTRPLKPSGWEARAVVLDAVGQEVSAAEAECGTEGDTNWVSKPRFQQRSMAQTRAVSKALRTCLSWVVVLAGYQATPAEEMDHAQPAGPKRGDGRIAQRPASEKQIAFLVSLAESKKGRSKAELDGWLRARRNIGVDQLTGEQASKLIEAWKDLPDAGSQEGQTQGDDDPFPEE